MKFQQAYNYYLTGNKIRRKSWSNIGYFISSKDGSQCESCALDITFEDAIADDWQVLIE